MREDDLLEIKKAQAYLDGLVKYADEAGNSIENDEILVEFLQNWLRFKINMSLKLKTASKFANKHMREVLNLES